MLHEPVDSPLAPPAAAPGLRSAPDPEPPADLRPLVGRARRDVGAARELASALLARGWAARPAAALSGLAETAVRALTRVRRPGTAAGFVADDLTARVEAGDPSPGVARSA